MADGKREREETRSEIAKLDALLLSTIEKRARASKRIGELRAADGEPATLPLGDRAIIDALVAKSTGDLPHEALRGIFREVLAACLALELPVTIAYVGPEGGPAHVAARARFGVSSHLIAAETPEAAMHEVQQHRAEYAVVPLETRAEGPVQATIAALAQNDLRIGAAIEDLKVRYAIVGLRPSRSTGSDLTSFIFSVSDAPGALIDVLRQFAERGINLVKIHSRPAEDAGGSAGGDAWAYLFFVEILGHATDRNIISAFEEVKRLTKFFKVLGSYPGSA